MRRISITLAVLACALASVLGAGVGSAFAAAPVEGIWSFNGGEVGIQVQPSGTFIGTVVAPTKFSQCFHPTGEQVWTQMSLQPNGSYWGLHQWYFETEACVANPTLGLTAWRVLAGEDGQRFLRVCFSEPGSSSQPEISSTGAETGATFGCVDSMRVSALPELTPEELGQYLAMPPNVSCLHGSKLRVRAQDPPNDPLEKVVVRLRSGSVHRLAQLKRRAHSVTAILSLRGLPQPRFVVRVRLRTVLGEELSRRRVYRRCGAPRRLHLK